MSFPKNYDSLMAVVVFLDRTVFCIYNITMDVAFDDAKNAANIGKHGVDFAQAGHFDWATAQVAVDTRFAYGEKRYIAQGLIGNRLHILIFTLRGVQVRIISLRKSNLRERKAYEKAC